MRRLAAVAVLLAVSCSYPKVLPATVPEGPDRLGPTVQVRLTADASRVAVSSPAGFAVRAAGAGQPVTVSGAVALVAKAGGGVAVEAGGRVRLKSRDTLRLEPGGEAGFELGERKYRGGLKVFRDAGGALAVVNVLPLEHYLYSVVPCEIGPIRQETFEAVKAQAVAARSFTITRLGRRKGLGHDLFDSYLRDQEYRGSGRETELGRSAVDATRGEVLRWQGEVAEALYHAACGGVTASGAKPFLRSVRDTPGQARNRPAFCSSSSHFSWQVTLSRDSLERSLGRKAGTGRLRVWGLTLVRDQDSGRVAKVRVRTDRGSRDFSGPEFRFALGLKSHWFDVKLSGRSVTISGHGWGHGAGMCQHGAVEMARRGYSCRQILEHYYSGVTVERLY
uniref:SpoIID/LytB domain-containing protein n=1 Tax=candidate division WOR-3 bacterium TaxID=2052148 RepID=A0A7C4CBY6_UNCW3